MSHSESDASEDKAESSSAWKGDFPGTSLNYWEECERARVSGPGQMNFRALIQRTKVWKRGLHLGSVV